jgi:hypothetical protein
VAGEWSGLRVPRLRELFEPWQSKEGRAAIASARTRSTAPREHEPTDAPPAKTAWPAPTRVVMTARAWARLKDHELGGVEMGGGLFGRIDGDAVVIEDVCGSSMSDRAVSDQYTCRISGEYLDTIERHHLETTGWRLVGDWHSHVQYRGKSFARASDADLAGWLAGLKRYARAYVGIIVSPRCDTSSPYAWWNPATTVHLVHRDADGQVQTNIVTLEVEA